MKCRRTDPAHVLTHRNPMALLSGSPLIRKPLPRLSYFSGAVLAALHLSFLRERTLDAGTCRHRSLSSLQCRTGWG